MNEVVQHLRSLAWFLVIFRCWGNEGTATLTWEDKNKKS